MANRSKLADTWATIDPVWAWSPLAPMPGEWNVRLAGHLLRRAGFGGTPKEIQRAVESGLEATLNSLCAPPESDSFDREMDAVGDSIATFQQPQRLAAWWLLRMVQTPSPLREKMTLFWHGHFATSAAKVRDNRALLTQNQTLRRYALGSFEELVQAISRDVAMLIYLDSTDNRKTRPNENYARELLELFCLGLGHYSEQDIKQLARCFTGWEVRQGRFQFNPAQYDGGVKSLFGESGAFDGEEAVRLVLRQPASPRFIARKLVRFFVADDVEIPDALLEPLAHQLRRNDFHIEPTVRTILSSKLFFSEYAIAQKLKSPVELAVGVLRTLGTSANMDRLAETLDTLGQLPFFPPNVKGWDGGRNWINAATLLARNRLARQLIEPLAGQSVAELSRSGWHEIAQRTPDEMMEGLFRYWLAMQPPAEVTNILLTVAQRGQNAQRLCNALIAISAIPEFQLC